ncbi:histone-fold-containing protein [Dendrothele bispora CBS 962.96]|uniref:Histone-fold-containing protein n=1 Tax=Dendrothele bispora (strain CBS 962.96) TaxID=1314807 RepID=A0A4S8LJJ5_DENBC|nr:histone-fold-containing protein [Dendrothele bispora CBS 962.96]
MPHKQSKKPFVQPGEPLNDFLPFGSVKSTQRGTRRLTKVTKMDPDVKIISADALILQCKACELFISEITSRTFIISDYNKRHTLSRSDIAAALSKSDQFDFLLDIVPRDIGGMRKREIGDGSNQGVGGGGPGPSGFNGGAASGGNSGVGKASGSGQVGQAKAEGLEGLQAFDEEDGNVDGRRMVNRSGDVLEELELLLEKPHGLPGAGSSDVVRLS